MPSLRTRAPVNTSCSPKIGDYFTRLLLWAPNLDAMMQRADEHLHSRSLRLICLVLMMLWGQEQESRRPPRVLLEK